MKPKTRRLVFLIFLGLCLSGASVMAFKAMKSSMLFFVSPSELVEHQDEWQGKKFRLGGLVHSLKAEEDLRVTFQVTDQKSDIEVTYTGILPDLFREGQGIVAEGTLDQKIFKATKILAKHDENYMPPEVAAAIKRAGQWKG